MQPYALKPVEVARFKRNTQDIKDALKRLKASGAEAICLVGTYKPLAHFINLAAQQNYNPQFTSVSFVSSEELFSRIAQPSRILVTEVMPTANGCLEEWCKRFISLMKKAGVDKPSRVHLEGYANAYLFYNAAKGCGKLTNDCLLLELKKAKEKLDKAKRNYVELSEKVKGNTVFLNHFTYSK